MRTTPNKSEAAPAPSKPANAKPPDIASASVPDMLAALHVNPDTGLTDAEVDVRRKEHGYNEVAEKRGHPVLKFLRKFWGISAWMLELIMVLSAVLGKYSDLVVVGALLVINAVLSFMQERRVAGVVEALRRRLQVNARVRRESSWQVIPARELVPGDIVRVRPGDIIPADVKLLTGALTVDQSALTGESKDANNAAGIAETMKMKINFMSWLQEMTTWTLWYLWPGRWRGVRSPGVWPSAASGLGLALRPTRCPTGGAGLIVDVFSAHQRVEDDDIDVMCLGSRVTGDVLSWDLAQTCS